MIREGLKIIGVEGLDNQEVNKLIDNLKNEGVDIGIVRTRSIDPNQLVIPLLINTINTLDKISIDKLIDLLVIYLTLNDKLSFKIYIGKEIISSKDSKKIIKRKLEFHFKKQ